MDLLSIEKESVYRRLRKNIIFPVHEVAKIASAWNISLDDIIEIDADQISFRARIWNYVNPSKGDLESMQKTIQRVDALKNIPDLEYLEVCNKMPRSLTSGFLYLRRFQMLRWMYQAANDEVLPFSKINLPPMVSKLSSDYYMYIKNLANTSYIWDFMLFNSVVGCIRYFNSIYLITDEEKELIKNDLQTLIDYMSEVASKGCWPETGNKVNLYISHINIDTNYSYFYSNEMKACIVHAFVKSELISYCPEMVEDFRAWMQLKKKSSVLISGADEKSRIEFFMKQRELIDTL